MKAYLFLIWIVCVGLVGWGGVKLSERSEQKNLAEEFLFLPQGPHVRLASLGHPGLWADFLLIRGMVYFGAHYRDYAQGRYQYEWLYHILDVVTDLDPGYYEAYSMGGNLLPTPQQRIALYQKALRVFPQDWKLHQLLAFQYFHELGDKKMAAHYYALGSRLPGQPPPFLASLAGKFYEEAGYYEAAIGVLREFAQKTEREGVRQAFLHQAERLEMLLVLQVSVEIFRQRQGRFPITLEELFLFGVLQERPMLKEEWQWRLLPWGTVLLLPPLQSE